MTIANPVYRYLHNLAYGRKKGKVEELYGLSHDLLTAAMNAAVTARNASVVLGAQAEKANSLSGYRLAEKLVADAEACEKAVKAAGGYMKYEEGA